MNSSAIITIRHPRKVHLKSFFTHSMTHLGVSNLDSEIRITKANAYLHNGIALRKTLQKSEIESCKRVCNKLTPITRKTGMHPFLLVSMNLFASYKHLISPTSYYLRIMYIITPFPPPSLAVHLFFSFPHFDIWFLEVITVCAIFLHYDDDLSENKDLTIKFVLWDDMTPQLVNTPQFFILIIKCFSYSYSVFLLWECMCSPPTPTPTPPKKGQP